ncbi:MFS transporter [Sporosarcina sp. HYO08]|nr:MFS transporter [Sporosarcina sp. HYO08]
MLSLIQADFNFSYSTASLLITIPDFLMGILALTTPWLARRYGRNTVILFALLLLTFSTIARVFSPNTFSLLLTTVGVGAGIAIVGTLMGGFIKLKFPTKAALLMGIYTTALSLGTAVSAGTTGIIASNADSGWRLASGIWAVPGVLAIIAWIVVILQGRKDNSVSKETSTAGIKLPIRNRTAWMIALYFGCVNFLFYALISWTSLMYQELGKSVTVSGFILLTFTVVFMLANPIFGWLSKSLDRRGWLAASSVLAIVGLIAIAIGPNLAPFIFISIFAFGLGGAFTLSMTLPLDNTNTVEESNDWNAFVLTVGYLIAATGPFLVGFMRDISGDFSSSIWLLVGVTILMLVLTPFLKPNSSSLQ